MIYKKLGNSNLKVSVIGYGGWALGKDGWGDVNDKNAARTLEKAFEAGINFYDTAPIYGRGKSEIKLGVVLGSVRKKIILATKCGLLWDKYGKVTHNLSKDAILYDIDKSLNRLNTDYIDLYQVHWPDETTNLEETFLTLNQLKKEGTIKQIGICNYKPEKLEQIIKITDIVSLQYKYNILERAIEQKILPFARKNNLGMIAYSPLAQGLLTNKIDKNYKLYNKDIRKFNPLFTDKALFQKQIELKEKLKKPVIKTALEFLLTNPLITTVLISMTRPKHLEENIKYFNQIMENRI